MGQAKARGSRSERTDLAKLKIVCLADAEHATLTALAAAKKVLVEFGPGEQADAAVKAAVDARIACYELQGLLKK